MSETRASFAGKSALIVGGSRGIGESIADALHGAGATVFATSRSSSEASRLADRYGTREVVLDTREAAEAASTVADLIRDEGPIELLVNNAGVNRPEPFFEISLDTWDLVQETNVRGVFVVSQVFAKGLRDQDRKGSIVTIGSQAGIVAIEDRAAYCTSKSALTGLTRAMAFELARYGIRANVVAPTFVRTEMTAATLDNPTRGSEFLSRIPLATFAEPEDVASATLYLLSEEARMVTGHTLVVDGGWTVW